MSGERSAILVEGEFDAVEISKDPKYVRVGRVILKNELISIEMDVNFDLFPMAQAQKYDVIITQSFLPSYKKDYAYAMYGKIFKIDLEPDLFQSIYISFGGLVLKMNGKLENMSPYIKNETRCYILLKNH